MELIVRHYRERWEYFKNHLHSQCVSCYRYIIQDDKRFALKRENGHRRQEVQCPNNNFENNN